MHNQPINAVDTRAQDTRGQRQEWIDALRGFALLGILLYNMQVFCGYVFARLLPQPVIASPRLDAILDFAAHVLIQGNFYSLFSFLFGLGVALQLGRGSDAEVSRLRRRFGWLLAIGLVHALAIWFGDILTVYALFGFALLLFRRVSDRALLGWALGLLALPVVLYAGFMLVELKDPLAAGPRAPGFLKATIHAIRSGGYLDVVAAQATLYPGGWLRRAAQLALPRIFGMMLLGMWAARVGLHLRRRADEPIFGAWLGCALAFALSLKIVLSLLGGNQALFPVSFVGWLASALASMAMPLLCMGYIGLFALYWRPRPHSLLVASGRAALSHYLGQSILCVGIFYGFGLGLFGRLTYAQALIVAAAVYLALAYALRAWLTRFGQGPVELLWRLLTESKRATWRRLQRT